MREYVSTTGVRRNKAESLIGVEPFDFALLNHFYSVLIIKKNASESRTPTSNRPVQRLNQLRESAYSRTFDKTNSCLPVCRIFSIYSWRQYIGHKTGLSKSRLPELMGYLFDPFLFLPELHYHHDPI